MIHLSSNLKFLRGKRGITAQVLADTLKVSRGTVTNWENSISVPDLFSTEKLAEFFKVPIGDFLTVDLSRQDSYPQHETGSVVVNDKTEEYIKGGDAVVYDMTGKMIMYVPLVSEYAYGSYLRGFADPIYLKSLPRTPWIVDREHKGNYLSFEVAGDSMDDNSRDSLIAHDLLLTREVKRELWQDSKLHYKKYDFVIAHKTKGIVVKRVIDHDVSKGIITLHSLNGEYADFEIQVDDVQQIFNILQIKRTR